MKNSRQRKMGLLIGASLAGMAASPVIASDASGELFFTRYQGFFMNVSKVSFTYDDTAGTALLGAVVDLAHSPGADGIIFHPNGDLLIGGQGANRVYQFKVDGTPVSSGDAKAPSFHLALDPSSSKVWTSNFGGDLAELPLNPNVSDHVANGGLLHNVTGHDAAGDDEGVTQLAFAPPAKGGKTFYVNGNPNGFGNVGLIDMATFETDRFLSGVESAHGMVYDSFTGLMTLFGAGKVGTFDPSSGTPQSTFKQTLNDLNGDFDQGAVDGKGHALVAGFDSITFIDYSSTHDITNPDFVKVFPGFLYIDDVAPLSGLGSNEPPPTGTPDGGTTLALLILGSGIVCFGKRARQ